MRALVRSAAVVLAVSALLLAAAPVSAEPRLEARLADPVVVAGALQGGELGPPLVESELQNGDSTEALIFSIGAGYPERGMPAFGQVLPPELVKGLALFVSEKRQGFGTTSASWESRIPTEPQRARDHDFRVELVAALESRPYSIAPLPDGRILVTEPVRGLTIVDTEGIQGPLIADTPRVAAFREWVIGEARADQPEVA